MSIDGTLIGSTAAKLMERLEEDEENRRPELVSVLIVAEVEVDHDDPDEGERGTVHELQCSSQRVTVASGLVHWARLTLDRAA